jgi:hypothetical protein
MRPIILSISLAGFVTSLYASECPTTLLPEQLVALKEKGIIQIQDTVYELDGSSLKVLENSNLEVEGKVAYSRKHDGNKHACWYNTNHGYIGIKQVRQK